MATATQNRSYTYDASQLMKDAGLVAASAAATVAAAAKVLDTQGGVTTNTGPALFKGVLVVDVSAIEIASTDEVYDIIVQGSDSSTFASGIENLAQLNLAAAAVRDGGAQASTIGRYELFFTNEQNGANYRYLRVYTKVAGTIATGINYTALIGRDYLTNA